MPKAYLVGGVRTPFGRYGGVLASVRTDDLAARVLAELMGRFPSVAGHVDEVILGCANQAGEDNRNVARMAGLLAGLGVETPGVTVNRLCGSGLEAIMTASRLIKSGDGEIVIAGGVEGMSRAPFVMPKAASAYDRAMEVFDTTLGWRFVNTRMREEFGVDSMGETAENVAQEFSISRDDQDAFAMRSQERAAKAQENGRLGREIVSVEVQSRRETKVVDRDEHPRLTSLDKLAELKPAFRNGGTVTAGNASGLNDGAAAVLVASERAVERYSLTPVAEVMAGATAGVPPRIMGIGPVPASRRVMDRLNLRITDFGVIELNEAFAAQSLACLRQLGLPDDADFVNPNGGAIALGHPLGASGARLALTATTELGERDLDLALVTMCIGVGQGIAAVFKRVD
ncbi:3-oxoadipyl-CoA thiolase [Ferrimicrobium acidiphilum]|jgi:3-oxoadipyl-CoA thiolase|uniref:Beta-ketoadipyl-CoA thiolase n=1 Tax=Ferrimicrobium acidiphilum DSM 19497 TaxID=1121877 RepID=A0A0D8FRY3_9ACTN|nr:3-oxoadipyl-CoA thiolase [Ferrimicrobium acidiphilum]KJE76043.1 3-oxoadipyl-CoA/3-oxo-5,6-dehydrosuberyl-CoA thiolase [Ferrimicrobium acidiphilum DSM 19497]MCL5052329.1 3-oxoadipyl-CoA thiolase [Gammaproteobacteria bacterium]